MQINLTQVSIFFRFQDGAELAFIFKIAEQADFITKAIF
jgi:hypothetical protein